MLIQAFSCLVVVVLKASGMFIQLNVHLTPSKENQWPFFLFKTKLWETRENSLHNCHINPITIGFCRKQDELIVLELDSEGDGTSGQKAMSAAPQRVHHSNEICL